MTEESITALHLFGSRAEMKALAKIIANVMLSMLVCTCIAHDQPEQIPQIYTDVKQKLLAEMGPGFIHGKTPAQVLQWVMYRTRTITEEVLGVPVTRDDRKQPK